MAKKTNTSKIAAQMLYQQQLGRANERRKRLYDDLDYDRISRAEYVEKLAEIDNELLAFKKMWNI